MIKHELPEAYALRAIRWQLFCVLTFKRDGIVCAARRRRVFTFLVRTAESFGVRKFKSLLWIIRWEYGGKTKRGHYHILIGGLSQQTLSARDCSIISSLWQPRNGVAWVEPYNPALDGVGYVLKRPSEKNRHWTAESARYAGDDCEPMLSDSIYEALRRGVHCGRGRI